MKGSADVTLATYPQTIYAASLLYQKPGNNVVFSVQVIVSGDNPLEPAEVRDRADAKAGDIHWGDGSYGDRADYELTAWHVSWVVQKSAPFVGG